MADRDRSGSDDPQNGAKTEDAGRRINNQRSRKTPIEELLSQIEEHAWRKYFQGKRGHKQNRGSD